MAERESQGQRRASQTVDDILAASGGRRDLRRLPSLVARAFSLVWKSAPRQFLLAGGLQVAAGASLALQLLVVRRILEQVTTADGAPGVDTIAPDLALFAALLIIVTLANVAQREQQLTLGEFVQKFTTNQVMDVSTRVDLIEYERPSFYDRLQRARVNASTRPMQIANGVLGLLGGGVAVLGIGATLVLIEPWIVLLITVGAIPSILLNRLASRLMHGFAVRQTPGDRRRDYLYRILSRKEEAQEVRSFASSIFLREEHERLYDDRIEDLRRTVRRRLLYGTLSGVVAAAVTVGAIVLLLEFMRIGRLSIADAAAAIAAVILIAGQVRGLVGSGGSLYEGALFLEDFTSFVAIAPRLESVRRERNAPVLASEFTEVQLDEVSFTYPSRDEPSLRDITLRISHGEVVALVGENGSGKTTLTKLLAGLYRPTSGRLAWDGVAVDDLELAEVRDQVTVIFQDFARYFLTARENVGISRVAHMSDAARIVEAAQRAGADRFLSSLPGGYEALLGPAFVGGSDLSTGQWQRVALARAYFRDAPMLILDEPTAALDPRGEYEIFQQVRRLAEGHTVILVSHRFSSVRAADRILVLDQGRIVEDGSHDQLLAEQGLYAELFNIQAEGYRGSAR